MQFVFLGALLAGLLAGVYFMIRGVERRRPDDHGHGIDAFGREFGLGRISLKSPVVAALATAFGLTGYLLTRFSELGAIPRLVLAALVAGATVAGAILLVARWAVPGVQRDVIDERYVLQGHLARVTRPISATSAGEVVYEIEGRRIIADARSLDGDDVDAETDVVIERVEDGVVFVEPWLQVEQRL